MPPARSWLILLISRDAQELGLVLAGGGSEWLVDRSPTNLYSQGGAAPRDERKGMAAAGQAAIPMAKVQ